MFDLILSILSFLAPKKSLDGIKKQVNKSVDAMNRLTEQNAKREEALHKAAEEILVRKTKLADERKAATDLAKNIINSF